ncbi:hypothetical protein HDU79_006810 [Rhizoclosmatium sp. JEL0117]|nr:hypothetical protein HDU79_006810 [Rhizoclosmatium sp. JEL0117]
MLTARPTPVGRCMSRIQQSRVQSITRLIQGFALNGSIMPIAISAKIYFNMAICYINMNQLDKALVSLAIATKRDPFFALAHFIRGIIYFKMTLFAKALTDFTNVLKNMRSALVIDYTQLGLSHKLFAFEALFNRGLCHSALGNQDASLSDYDEADLIHPTSAGFGDRPLLESKIDQACDLGSRALHSISLYEMDYELAIFKPNEQKVLNAQKVDYIGSPKVILDSNNHYEFLQTLRKQGYCKSQ